MQMAYKWSIKGFSFKQKTAQTLIILLNGDDNFSLKKCI